MKKDRDGLAGVLHADDIHHREMLARVHWAVRLRWFFVAACLAAGLFLPAVGLPRLAGGCFLVVGGSLAAANALFGWRLRGHDRGQTAAGAALRALCLGQVAIDYLGLSVVTYALGSVETPVMFLVLPNCILVALYFPARQSLAVALAGFFLAVLPLVLELAGVIPTERIFGPDFKDFILASPVILLSYLAFLALAILFCWYLASVIRRSLLANEETIEARYRDLLQLNREKTTAVLRGTHELKAPLAAIRSYASTLRDGYCGVLPDKARHVVERIGKRCDRLLATITDVIRLGNLQSGVRVGETLHGVEIGKLLAEEVAEAAAGGDKGVTVLYEPPPAQVWVRATEEHLHTLFGNLIGNAVRYSRSGGAVRVEVAATGEGRPRVTVRDHGIGIPSEAMSHIFVEHYRAGNAVRHDDSGTGLGLPIAKAAATLLGAEITVESEIDHGTVCTVTFPGMTGKEE